MKADYEIMGRTNHRYAKLRVIWPKLVYDEVVGFRPPFDLTAGIPLSPTRGPTNLIRVDSRKLKTQ